MIPRLHQWLAQRRLQRITDAAAQSPATISYRMHRPAAKRGAATRAANATSRAITSLQHCRAVIEGRV